MAARMQSPLGASNVMKNPTTTIQNSRTQKHSRMARSLVAQRRFGMASLLLFATACGAAEEASSETEVVSTSESSLVSGAQLLTNGNFETGAIAPWKKSPATAAGTIGVENCCGNATPG